VIRDGEVPDEGFRERVLVVQTLGAPHPSQKRRKRGPGRAKKASSPPEIPDVPVTRSTLADSTPFAGEAEAKRWLKTVTGSPKRRADHAREALDVLNRALETLRRHSEDPLVGDASFHHALVVRIGYGSGEQLADGEWAEAREMPSSPTPRHADLDAQRKTAIELAGREPDEPEEPGDS
jgi:hypothetical protein